MKDLLKQRMSAAQQVSEMEIGNRVYESLIDPLPAAASTIRELPVDKLRPFFTTDIGFHPYSPEKLRAFAQQLLEQGLLERIIVRSIPGSDEYEILAGHNRTAAWRMAGHDTIPAEVVVANDARAIIIATATNLLRRQELTIIERGKAYKAMLEAKRRQGERTDLGTSGDFRQKFLTKRNRSGFLWRYRIRDPQGCQAGWTDPATGGCSGKQSPELAAELRGYDCRLRCSLTGGVRGDVPH